DLPPQHSVIRKSIYSRPGTSSVTSGPTGRLVGTSPPRFGRAPHRCSSRGRSYWRHDRDIRQPHAPSVTGRCTRVPAVEPPTGTVLVHTAAHADHRQRLDRDHLGRNTARRTRDSAVARRCTVRTPSKRSTVAHSCRRNVPTTSQRQSQTTMENTAAGQHHLA